MLFRLRLGLLNHAPETNMDASPTIEVAALYIRGDSIYKTFPQVDPWDESRDARQWPGGAPAVCHPPCRAWGRLRQFAKPRPDERDLARHAVAQIRYWGGVLEHPAYSTLWADQKIPRPGQGQDDAGGWTLPILQFWFGHRAPKATWLYIVGCGPKATPEMPFAIGDPPARITWDRRNPQYPELTKAEREATPPALARWLIEIAKIARTSRPELYNNEQATTIQ
jgi:hypothetical protein